jgi:surface antigen
VAWENFRTGAHGTVTPLSGEASADCRDFLLSHVEADKERWMQGDACRSGAGKWQIRSLKPWAMRV